MRPLAAIALASLLLLTAVSCSGINDPSKNTVVDFPDTIEPGAGKVYEFDVTTNNGEYTVTLIALAPDPSSRFNIYLGQVVNGLCLSTGQEGTASLNRSALGPTPIQRGHYCIQMYDLGLGAITRPQTYTLRVSHPR